MKRLVRYNNKKIYDTELARYVNISEIAQLVRQNFIVQVLEYRTGRDLTAYILSLVVVEMTKNGEIDTWELERLVRKENNIDTVNQIV